MASEEFMYERVRQTAYDGATTNFRLEQRGLVNGDSDTLAARELKLLWARSNHALRNNGWALTARTKHKTNLGAIKVKWKDQKGKIHKKMQMLWDKFASDPTHDGYGTLANIQDEWNGGIFDGEVFCRMLIRKREGFDIPLVLQNISREYLDPLYTGNLENTRNGITFTEEGKPLIYHFSKKLKNQGILSAMVTEADKVKVPAEEVLHIFAREQVGQWRGIPMLAAILLPLYELDDLTDATVAKQKNAQAISWIITNTNPTSAVSVGSHLVNLDSNENVDETTGKTRKVTQATGGGVQYLNKGEMINSVQAEGVGAELIDLIKLELHKIAATAGLSYEYLTGDLSGVSLAALQEVAINMKVRAEYIYNLYTINLGLLPLCNRFKELASIYVSGTLSQLEPQFQLPRRYSSNELKDAQADLLELQSKLGTWSSKLEERDLTPEDIEEDIARQKIANVTFEVTTLGSQGKDVKAAKNTKG